MSNGSVWSDVRAFPRAAWMLFAGTLINRFGSFVLVFLVLYLTKRGYSALEAGLAVSAYGVGGVVSSLAGGYLADRIGRRNTIAISMFAAGINFLVMSQAESLWLITMLGAFAGFSAELYRPASSALLTDLTQPAQRVTAFALYRLAINMGMAAGPAVGGFLAERSFTFLFVGDAFTCVVFGVVALVALPPGRGETHEETRNRSAVKVILADTPFLFFLGASFVIALVYFQYNSGLALHIGERFSNTTYGMMISLNGLLVMLIELPLSSVTRRLPARPVMAVGCLLTGIGFALTGLAGTVWLLAATVCLWTLGEIVFMPVAAAYVANIAPGDMRGRYQGTWGVVFGGSLVVSPTLGVWVYATQPQLLWVGLGTLGLSASVLALAGKRHSD